MKTHTKKNFRNVLDPYYRQNFLSRNLVKKRIRGTEEMEEEWQKKRISSSVLKPGYLSVFHPPRVCPP